jgi:hypothetical protein
MEQFQACFLNLQAGAFAKSLLIKIAKYCGNICRKSGKISDLQ